MQHLMDRSTVVKKKNSLESMRAMTRLLGHPEKKFRSIHIGGTNGKGSVSLKIATALEYSHYKCGLFTSPHISQFGERIVINSQCISEEQITEIMSEIIAIAEQANIEPTYFEYCTLIAFQFFAQEKVDVAVIEVGLGGRLDATNLIEPILSIVTSISKDHTEILGSSEEEIAQEKAGIIKSSIPVLLGPHTPVKVFRKVAEQLNAPLICITEKFSHFGLENTAIAATALELIKKEFPLSTAAIQRAKQIEPPCRFEIVSPDTLARSDFSQYSHIPIVLDVAHNPDGIKRLIQRLQERYPTSRYRFAFKFSSSKDMTSCAELLGAIAKSIHILEIDHPRLASSNQVKQYFSTTDLPIYNGPPQTILKEAFSTMDEQ